MADEDFKKLGVTSLSGVDPAATATQAADTNEEDPFDGIKGEMKTRFELLPEEVQKVIVDDNYQLKLFEIAKAHKLTFEELGMLETETTMVLLGMTKPEDYRYEVQLQLKKNDAEIDPLVKEVSQQVFDPIRASLEKVYSGYREPEDYMPEDGAAEAQPAVAATPAPAAPAEHKPGLLWKPAQAPIATPMPGLSSAEKSVLEKTGVVISETPAMAPAPTSMPNRLDVLKGIENPPKAASASLVADKLGAPAVSMPTKVTDYSVPKAASPAMGPIVPAAPGTDPYREKI